MGNLLAHFPDLRPSGAEWIAKCPAHDDHNPSLSISVGEDGRVLLHCHAGCPTESVLSAAGLSFNDLFPEKTLASTVVKTDVYVYRDEVGTHLFDVVRFHPKSFRQRRADGKWSMEGVRRVLYGLPELQREPLVFVVEGEKDADRLQSIGLPATTAPGGAGKWRDDYTQQLISAGVKSVVILPDNDDAGREHAELVAHSCASVNLAVKVVSLPSLPMKGDVSDWLDGNRSKADLTALTDSTPLFDAQGDRAVDSSHEHHSLRLAGRLGGSSVQTPPRPRPLDSSAFEGIVGEIVRAIAPHTEADVAGLLVQGLTAFGNVIGHRPHVVADGAYHHMNLDVVLVGKTAKGRKGTSWQQIRRLFEAVDPTFRDRIEFGLSSGEGLINAVRDPNTQGDNVEDSGVKDKRLLIVEGEFARVIKNVGREGNILSAVIREAWDSGHLGTLTKHNRLKATDAHISIIGHITQDELRRYLSATEAANGFGNRFLWVSVERSRVLPYGGRLPDAEFDPLVQALAKAIEHARNVGLLEHDPSARDLWVEVYPSLSEGKPGLLGAMTSRAEAQVLRLAALYALTDRSFRSYVVGASHLRSALELWRYCFESARYIFGDSLGDAMADRILANLRASDDGLTRSEIRDALNRNAQKADVDRALSILEEHGKAYRSQSRADGSGKATERWRAR